MRVLKLCIALVFAHHVVCTALYLSLPDGPTFYRRYVMGYMKPVFLQYWELFAEPIKEYQKVLVRCEQGEWIDPMAAPLRRFQSARPWKSGKEFFMHLSYVHAVGTALEKDLTESGGDVPLALRRFEERVGMAEGLRRYVLHACGPTEKIQAITYKVVTVGTVAFAARSRQRQTEVKREILFPELKLGN